MEEASHVPSLSSVLSELRERLSVIEKLDSVTMAGNSEPSAHPDFRAIVEGVLELRESLGGKWVFNCLSNGSELDRPDVVRALDSLDEAWIKLDCATDDMFFRMNRPLKRVESVAKHIQRISRLRKARIQTLVWNYPALPSLGNWNPENKEALFKAYAELKPVEIHLTTVKRETAFPGLQQVPYTEMENFAAELRKSGLEARVFA